MSVDNDNNDLALIHGEVVSRGCDVMIYQQLPTTRKLFTVEELRKVDADEGMPSTVESDDGPPRHSLYEWMLAVVFSAASCALVLWIVPFDHFFRRPAPKVKDGIVLCLTEKNRNKLPKGVQGVLERIELLRSEGKTEELIKLCNDLAADDCKLKSKDWLPVWGMCLPVFDEQFRFNDMLEICRKVRACAPDDPSASYYYVRATLKLTNPIDVRKIDKQEREKSDHELEELAMMCKRRLSAIKGSHLDKLGPDRVRLSDKFRLLLGEVLVRRWKVRGSKFDHPNLLLISDAVQELGAAQRSDKKIDKELMLWQAVQKEWPWCGRHFSWDWCRIRIGDENMSYKDVTDKVNKLHEERQRTMRD